MTYSLTTLNVVRPESSMKQSGKTGKTKIERRRAAVTPANPARTFQGFRSLLMRAGAARSVPARR